MNMSEDQMFSMVRELCKACGMGIYRISKECNINPKFVAKLFMKTMQSILDKMGEQ